MRRRCSAALILAALASLASAAEPVGRPAKVPLAFNRLYDYPELVEALKALVAAHPDRLTLESIGKSTEGRDLWCVTINDKATGPDRSKPAMYVDGNVHGNEVQAAEACLYLIWYLTENADRVDALKTLLAERAFYVIPTINPDGRAYWFNGPNTTHTSRSGKSPLDDDRDGVADEDGFDDLNGDGQITQMRRKVAGGSYKVSPEDPRLLVAVKPGEVGEYELLGMEGIDNDGDGLVNEDPPGGYDLNRNFPADWQPEHVQAGAGDFPLCFPETKAVADFLHDHPNVAGLQSFHNAAGMILRGPGHPSRQPQYPAADERIAAAISANGARMLPFYRDLVIHKDLYNVHGGLVGWAYEHLGIFSFTNELWNNDQLIGRLDPPAPGQTLARAVGAANEADQLLANDRLLFGTQFLPWTPVKHPLYGAIEVGGFVKQSQRIPPGFLLEELCHRNAAFVIYHAGQMPRIAFEDVQVASLSAQISSLTASIRNARMIPTIAAQAVQRRLNLPDFASVSGPGLTVVGGGLLLNRDTGEVRPAEHEPARLRIEEGVPGESTVRVRWFLRGKGDATVRYASQKGGTITKVVPVR